jgi:transketolase
VTSLTSSDYDAIEAAITEAKKSTDAPTIINMKTTIGYGSQKQGGHDVHGARECRAPDDPTSLSLTLSAQEGRHHPAQAEVGFQPGGDLRCP